MRTGLPHIDFLNLAVLTVRLFLTLFAEPFSIVFREKSHWL